MSDYNQNASNPKFNQLVTTAKELFYRYGIKRVTIEEICRESRVSKMTFYKFFPNKIELAKYLLNSIYDEAIAEYRQIIESDQPFSDKVVKLLELKRRGTTDISAEFIAELARYPEPGIAEIYKRNFDLSMRMTNEFMRKAQQDGEIRQDVKLEFILFMMNKMLEMSMDETLEKMYDTPQDMIMELMNFFFFGILKRQAE